MLRWCPLGTSILHLSWTWKKWSREDSSILAECTAAMMLESNKLSLWYSMQVLWWYRLLCRMILASIFSFGEFPLLSNIWMTKQNCLISINIIKYSILQLLKIYGSIIPGVSDDYIQCLVVSMSENMNLLCTRWLYANFYDLLINTCVSLTRPDQAFGVALFWGRCCFYSKFAAILAWETHSFFSLFWDRI